MLTGNNGILEQTKNAKENTNLAKKEEEKNLYDIPESEIQNVDWTTKDEDGAYSIQTHSDSVRSVMCSGIQWDIVMNFNNGKNDGNGNKYDVRTISDKNHIKK